MIETKHNQAFANRAAAASQSVWPRWPLLLALSVLFLGPVIAPLFQATGIWLVADSGALARDLLSQYVCPTPLKSYALLGFPMAVCARCWGATIGLWAAWFMFARTERHSTGPLAAWLSAYTRLPWPARLGLSAAPFALWYAEIVFWPSAPLGALLLNGALAGMFAGLFFFALWPGLVTKRAA